MRPAVLLLAVVLVAALVHAAPSDSTSGQGYPQGPCAPGSSALYQCNSCACAADGAGYICTRRVCAPPEALDARDKREIECTPGDTFRTPDGCNTCVCSDTGVAACTARACLPPNH